MTAPPGRPAQASRGETSRDAAPARPPDRRLAAALADLYATRESADPPPARTGQRRRPERAAAALRRPEQRSLFIEILDWMLVPLLLLWPLSVAVTFLIARSLADAPFDRALADRVEVIAQQLLASPGYLAATLVPGGPAAQGTPLDDERVLVQVLATDGSLLAGDGRLPAPGLYDFPEPDRIRVRNAQLDGRDLRVGYVYVALSPGADEGHALVQVAETTEKRNRLANEIIKGVIFPQFVMLPGAVLLVWFGLGRGLAPLKLLQQRIRERGPDDVSPIDPRGAPEEVGPLIDAFNELLARQNRSVRAQKRFIADAAHQIKTPLAGLQTQAELALRSQDPSEVRRSLELLLRSSSRAARMVSQLLAMARAEHMRDALAFEPLDLAALAREVVGDWVPAALARGIEVEFDAPDEPLRVVGHPLLLRELLNNLIDNALRYTPTGGSVLVRVAHGLPTDAPGPAGADAARAAAGAGNFAEGAGDPPADAGNPAAASGSPATGAGNSAVDAAGPAACTGDPAVDAGSRVAPAPTFPGDPDRFGVRLEVIDTGPGIPPADRELVFERFYRVPGTQVDGSGLGLAIVREIAQQHGAEVRVGERPQAPNEKRAPGGGDPLPGARLVVDFPAA